MQKNHDGLKAQSLLKTFEDESGVNPSGYFAIVAENLLGRFGERAISVAADAIQKMRLSGDDDGRLLWEGVSAQIWDRIGSQPRTAPVLLH